MSLTIPKTVHISEERVRRLERLAAAHGTTEDALIERALDFLFDLADTGDEEERRAWSALGLPSLQRVWDNDADAAYDNWKDLYGPPEG